MGYLPGGAVYYEHGDRRNLAPLGGDYTYNPPFTTHPSFAIEFLPKMHNAAFIGTDSLFRSLDINNAAPTWDFLAANGEEIAGVASCRADSNILYAITRGNHLLRSDNALAATPTFTTLSTPGATNVMASVATSKYNPNIVYITCGNKIYRSVNKGASWSNISYALPSLNIRKVIADEYSTTERLFVCLGSYVYYKDNTSTTWVLTNGLPTVAGISDFMVYNDSTAASILRLSTYGRGMWECNIQNNMPPTGSFTANKHMICPGDTVKYHKTTYGNITSFAWSFPGGVPSTSTSDSPVVVYPAAGVFNASLTLTGAYGNDTILKPGFIVASFGSTAPVTEGFEATAYPPAQWELRTESGVNWEQTATAGGFGTSGHCIRFDNFYNDAGGRHDRIVTPKLDLSFASNIWLKFDVAYAYYPGYKDSLVVGISTDCGRVFAPIYAKDSNTLATRADTTDYFTPTATEWRTDSISLSAYAGQHIMLAFENVGHYGQPIYLDNVNIRFNLPPVGINNQHINEPTILLYPNPATDVITITASGFSGKSVLVNCYSMMGQLVATSEVPTYNGQLNSSMAFGDLPRGLYEVVLQDGQGQRFVRKVVLR
jgi:PKD repeat protein